MLPAEAATREFAAPIVACALLPSRGASHDSHFVRASTVRTAHEEHFHLPSSSFLNKSPQPVDPDTPPEGPGFGLGARATAGTSSEEEAAAAAAALGSCNAGAFDFPGGEKENLASSQSLDCAPEADGAVNENSGAASVEQPDALEPTGFAAATKFATRGA